MLITLTVVIISQCVCIPKYHIVYLKLYIFFIFVCQLYLSEARGREGKESE